MDCDNCGGGVTEEWRYCPFCGSSLKRDVATNFSSVIGLGDILTDIDEEFRRMEDAFKSVWLDKKNLGSVKSGGISMRISSKEGGEPKIDVQTFGDYDKHAPKIEERLGIEKARIPARVPPKITKEPKTAIERAENKLILKVEVPGVTSEEDIDIRRMTKSIEVRAYAKDMAYFTLFSIPPNSRVLSKKLENEGLVIEVGGEF